MSGSIADRCPMRRAGQPGAGRLPGCLHARSAALTSAWSGPGQLQPGAGRGRCAAAPGRGRSGSPSPPPLRSFARQLSLGEGADSENLTACYADGVLHVTIPASPKAQARRVEVTRAASGSRVVPGSTAEAGAAPAGSTAGAAG